MSLFPFLKRVYSEKSFEEDLMKRQALLILLLIPIMIVTGAGCNQRLLDKKQLRKLYPAVFEGANASRIRAFSLNDAIRRHPLIVSASLSGEVEAFLKPGTGDPSTYYDYRRAKFKIIEILKGDITDKVITVSVPIACAEFTSVLVNGGKYLLMLAPADYVGENQWGTATDNVFYVSESNQIVPMIADEEHQKVMGITVEDFKVIIQEANQSN